jgi:hypothetical protein
MGRLNERCRTLGAGAGEEIYTVIEHDFHDVPYDDEQDTEDSEEMLCADGLKYSTVNLTLLEDFQVNEKNRSTKYNFAGNTDSETPEK